MLAAALTAKPTMYSRPSAPVRSGPLPQGPLGLMGAAMRFARNAEVYGEDEPAEFRYRVVSGAVRTYRCWTMAVAR
jgi:CRP/FNR family transcriptional regulator, nitrogen fixation regulation protein